ncbi:hypothetical protein [Amycolatopsis sp. NPDC004378]
MSTALARVQRPEVIVIDLSELQFLAAAGTRTLHAAIDHAVSRVQALSIDDRVEFVRCGRSANSGIAYRRTPRAGASVRFSKRRPPTQTRSSADCCSSAATPTATSWSISEPSLDLNIELSHSEELDRKGHVVRRLG